MHFQMTIKSPAEAEISYRRIRDCVAVYVSVNRPTHALDAEKSIVAEISGLDNITGMMGLHMIKGCWNRPWFGVCPQSLPEETQSLLWQDNKNIYHYMLPICDTVFRSTLCGGPMGLQLILSCGSTGITHAENLSLIYTCGSDPYALAARAAATAAELLPHTRTRQEKKYPEPFEYLGWCTWDSFYREVTADHIRSKMDEFTKKAVPVKWIIIDDGWFLLEEDKLCSFEEDRRKFPLGLKKTVAQLKDDYGVRWVGAWHALAAFYKGIHPNSTLYQNTKSLLFESRDHYFFPALEMERAYRFWDAWHSYLRKQGIDFIKVDVQTWNAAEATGSRPVGQTAQCMHQSLEASAAVNFDGCMINCMGLGNQNLFHRPYSAVSRNSDDFYPKLEGSFREHALQNAYNSFYHSQFYYGDWDMWWTKHSHDIHNAVLRAVSGGPVYISDPIGQTDPTPLMPLLLEDGRILRCRNNGVATEDCLLVNPMDAAIPLKICNIANGCGILAVFHVHPTSEKVNGYIRPADIYGLKGQRFVIYNYFEKRASAAERMEKLPLELKKEGYGLYLIIPVCDKITPLGLMDKYIAPLTIQHHYQFDKKDIFLIKQGGRFAFVADDSLRLGRAVKNGIEVIVHPGDKFYWVDCSGHNGYVHLEIEHS